MRSLEIILLVYVGIVLLRPFLGRFRAITYSPWYVVVGLLLTVSHLLVDGGRWQMVPVYCLITYTTIDWQIRSRRLERSTRAPMWHGVFGLFLLLLILTPLFVFPMPTLIEPSGSYSVGTTILYFKDISREEIYSPETDDKRELNLQVWYPAQVRDGTSHAPYMTNLELSAPAFAGFLGLPSFVLNHIDLIDTHALLDAPMATDEALVPVLVFSHGWGGTRTQSTYLMEELASHGYVVVAIDHTYGALVTVFPDDRVVLQKSDILQDHASEEEQDLSDNPLLDVWSADVSFVLDQLEEMNSESSGSMFHGRLDFSRVGIMGHSTGGGNTVQVCSQDSRCKAAFIMDGWLMPVSKDALGMVMEQPFMFLWSEAWGSDQNKERFDRYYAKLQGEVFNLEIMGTRHYDFSDLPLLSPLSPWFGLKGPIDGERVLGIINDYAVTFFNAYLKGVESTLLDEASPDYPEVEFDKR